MKKIKYASFHENIHVPGFGDFGKSLPPAGKTLEELQVYKLDSGEIYFQFRKGNQLVFFAVGSANVKVTQLCEPLKLPSESNAEAFENKKLAVTPAQAPVPPSVARAAPSSQVRRTPKPAPTDTAPPVKTPEVKKEGE